MTSPRIALVHYWLVSRRGGERVLEALSELYPDATIFTHFYNEGVFRDSPLSKHKIVQTFIGKLPFVRHLYQLYLPFMPLALEELDLRDFDLVISSESGPAKGVIVAPGVPHICYCHSPMRYLWDMYHDYRRDCGFIKKFFMAFLTHYLRRWDQLSSLQVTRFVANSNFVASRIKSYYNRDADVIFPPVNVDDFNISTPGDYFLVLGQLVAYKRVDLAVDAFRKNGRRLVVIGEGEELERLKLMASPNIEFIGHQSFLQIKQYLAECKALIFPGLEDFGMVPVEAMASGRPVIAFGKGGVLDSVINGVTGILFQHQTVEALVDAVESFETIESNFDPLVIRSHAQKFSSQQFKVQFQELVVDTQRGANRYGF